MTRRIKIDAEKAFELMYELFREHPWLNKPGVMRPEDVMFEQEAVAFLLTCDLDKNWEGCPLGVQRVVLSLLIDFMAKLRTPEHPISMSSWFVPADEPPCLQALAVIAQEIERSHPKIRSRH